MRALKPVLVAALFLASAVSSFAGGSHGNNAVTGKINLGVSLAGGIFKNIALGMGTNASLLTATPNWPSTLDANGYPNLNGGPPSNFGNNTTMPTDITTSTLLVASWSGAGAWYINTGSPGITVVSASSGTSSSDCGSLASLPKVCTFGARFSGTDVRVTFTLNSIPPSGNINLNFIPGTYSGMSRLIFAKQSDEAALLAQSNPADIWADSFIQWIKQSNPKVVRTLGLLNVNNGNNITRWDLRPNWKDAANFGGTIVPSLWSGAISKGAGDDYSIATPPSGWTGLFDGAVVQGYISTSNTTAFPTLTIDGTTKRIINQYAAWPTIAITGTVAVSDTLSVTFNAANLPGGTTTLNYVTTGSTTSSAASGLAAAINANSTLTTAGFFASYDANNNFQVVWPAAAGTPTLSASASGAETVTVTNGIGIGGMAINLPNTLIFDSFLDAWLWTEDVGTEKGGISYQTPMESMIWLANRANKHLWINIPCHANDDYVLSVAQYASTNLYGHLKLYVEYCNEIWNFAAAFDQTSWATSRGRRLGFAAGSNRTFYGYYGLRSRQIYDIMNPVLGSRMRIILASQAAGSTVTTDTYRYKGTDLHNATLSPGGQNYYQQLIGIDYNTFPNRPIDIADSISYADYMSGPQVTNQFSATTAPYDVGGPNTYTSTSGVVTNNATFGGWIEAADNFISGDVERQWRALQFMDWDVRAGIVPRSSVTSISASGCAVVQTSSNHSLSSGYLIALNTTGSFDAAITKGRNYFVISSGLTSNQFQFSQTLNGSCVTVSGASTGTITWGTVGGETFTNLTAQSNQHYSKWQTVAAGYNGARPAGKANVAVELYEGSYEAWYPTTGSCTSLGISTNYCGSTGYVAQMLSAYKNSSLFYQFTLDRLTTCAAQSNTLTCSWFQSNGFNQWALLSGNYGGYFSGNGTSNAYSSLYAIQKFNAD